MARFRKKQVEVQAMQWTPDDLPAAGRVADWLNASKVAWRTQGYGGMSEILLPTLEGTMEARPGDWIICGVKGEFYPCKPDIFAATYEAA